METTKAEDVGPVPSQQSLVVDFLENRQLNYRVDSDKIPCRYDTQLQQFVDRRNEDIAASINEEELRKLKLALATTNESFKDAVKALQEKNAKKGDKANAIITTFDLDALHDWTEVVNAVEDAVTKYESDERAGGKFRKAFRRVSEHAKSMKSFVGLLPDGEYKTLCGGLTLILTAMESHRGVREKMGEVFDSIPNFVTDCEDYVTMYPRQPILKYHVDNIYTALLYAMVDMLHWYKQPSRKHISSCLLKNSEYSQSIDIHVKRIQASKALFENETTKYLHWHTLYISHGIEAANESINHINVQLQGTNKAIADVHISVGQLNAAMINGNERMHAVQTTLESVTAGIAQGHQEVREVKLIFNNLGGVLHDIRKNTAWMEEVKKLQAENAALNQKCEKLQTKVVEQALTPDSLAKTLQLNTDTSNSASGVLSAQRAGISKSIAFQSRSKWVVKHKDFQPWFSSKDSQALCIQGHGERNKISPLSFLISLLHQQVNEDKALVLTFFCGLNAVSPFDKKTSAPLVLARSILGQLLARSESDCSHAAPDGLPVLSFLQQKTISRLQEDSFRAYLQVISALLVALGGSHGVIFVLIDGYEYYDRRWDSEMTRLIKTMMNTIDSFNERRENGQACTLKVLFTAATYSTTLASGNSSMMKIDMPRDIQKNRDGFKGLGQLSSNSNTSQESKEKSKQALKELGGENAFYGKQGQGE